MLLILTSNTPVAYYEELFKRHQGSLEAFIGPTQTFISGDTLQVGNYDLYHWTMFNAEEKKERREKVFPKECQAAFALGEGMCRKQA